MDDYEAHLRRFEIEISGQNDARAVSREFANRFAQLAIRQMFWLNGGALIALPAFVEAFSVDKSSISDELLLSFAAFVVGLVLIGVCSISAFQSMECDNHAIGRDTSFRANQMNRVFLETRAEVTSRDKSSIAKHRKNEAKALRSRNRLDRLGSVWYGLAIVTGFASMAAFVTGAYFAFSAFGR